MIKYILSGVGIFNIDAVNGNKAVAVPDPPDGGVVTVDPDTANAFTGTISGNAISAVVAGSRLGSPGLQISCTGAVRVTAAAFDNEIREGSISSTSLVCNGVALNLSGEFSGPEVVSTGFPGGRDARPILGALRLAVQTAL